MSEEEVLNRSIEEVLTRIKSIVTSASQSRLSEGSLDLFKRAERKVPLRSTKKVDPKFQEKDKLEMNPDFQKYRQMNYDLQKKALLEGRRLNKLCKEISPGYEGMIIGHQHKASGILITHIKIIKGKQNMFVLLVRENGQLNIPGGKAKEEESPWETAIREFMEEAFVIPETIECNPALISSDGLKPSLKDMFIPSAEYRPGCYTLFTLKASEVLLPTTYYDVENWSSKNVPIEEFEQIVCWENVKDLNTVLTGYLSDFLRILLTNFAPLKSLIGSYVR